MRKITVLLLLMGASGFCFCQEKIKVDMDTAAAKTKPKVTLVTSTIGDQRHGGMVWRVELSTSATAPIGSTMLEIRVVNVSAVPRALPVSLDGAKIVAECPDHTVSEVPAFLGSRADSDYFRELGVFYGCEAFPSTLAQLNPGEWVTYVTKVPTARLPKEIRAQMMFVRRRYRRDAKGQTAVGLDWDVFEVSPWVQIPEAPAQPGENRGQT